MPGKQYYVTKEEAAYLLGADVRSLTTWQNRKINPLPVEKKGKRGTSNQYDPSKLVQWKVEEEISKRIIEITGEDGETTVYDKEAQQARLFKEQADGHALKNAQTRREQAPIRILTWIISRCAAQIVPLLEALPLKLKKRLPKLTSAEVDIIKKEIASALNIVSRMSISLDEYESDSRAES